MIDGSYIIIFFYIITLLWYLGKFIKVSKVIHLHYMFRGLIPTRFSTRDSFRGWKSRLSCSVGSDVFGNCLPSRFSFWEAPMVDHKCLIYTSCQVWRTVINSVAADASMVPIEASAAAELTQSHFTVGNGSSNDLFGLNDYITVRLLSVRLTPGDTSPTMSGFHENMR